MKSAKSTAAEAMRYAMQRLATETVKRPRRLAIDRTRRGRDITLTPGSCIRLGKEVRRKT
jgi:plasmid stability protein